MEKIGAWEVLGLAKAGNHGSSPYWYVLCPKCKKKQKRTRRECLGNKSCRPCYIKSRITHANYGSIPGWYYRSVLKHAKDKNRKVDVSIRYLDKLFKKQDAKCALTGWELKFVFGSHKSNYDRSTTASLDRIDSSKGYIKGNLQWVHKDVQSMKSTYKMQRLIEVCHAVSNHTKGKEYEDFSKTYEGSRRC